MPKRNLILILAILLIAGGAVLLTRDHRPAVTDDSDDGELSDIGLVCRLIRENYYEPVDINQLKRGAVRGMTQSLDEYTTYVPPDLLETFRARMNGQYSGPGLVVERQGSEVVVVGPVVHSSAHRAGIRTGDRLVSVDKQELAGLDIEQVRDLLAGGPGDAVAVEIIRESEPEPMLFELECKAVPLESVTGFCRDQQGRWVYSLDLWPGMTYIRISEFVPSTADQIQRALRESAPTDALVLDLRGNPGGPLGSAAGVADLFLDEGTIVTQVGRTGQTRIHKAHSSGTILDRIPVVVLVDFETASAAEIVAGALKFHARAVLVGTRTRGKGCVQSMFRLGPELGQINLTTSEYILADEVRISRRTGSSTWGIDPHVPVILTPSQTERLDKLRRRAGALYQPPEEPGAEPTSLPDSGFIGSMIASDAQLAQAIGLIRDPGEMRRIIERQEAQQRRTREALVDDE